LEGDCLLLGDSLFEGEDTLVGEELYSKLICSFLLEFFILTTIILGLMFYLSLSSVISLPFERFEGEEAAKWLII